MWLVLGLRHVAQCLMVVILFKSEKLTASTVCVNARKLIALITLTRRALDSEQF